MAKATVTVKVKDIRLKATINLIKLVSCVSMSTAQRMLDWLYDNVDKFYTIEL